MTGPVDVLAVLGRHATGLRTAPRLTGKQAERVSDELRAARAAVAELIERERAMRETLDDVRAQCRRNIELGAEGSGYWTDLQDTVDAALARVGGAA